MLPEILPRPAAIANEEYRASSPSARTATSTT